MRNQELFGFHNTLETIDYRTPEGKPGGEDDQRLCGPEAGELSLQME